MACPCLQESDTHETIEWVHVQDDEEVKTIMNKKGEVTQVWFLPAKLKLDDGRVLAPDKDGRVLTTWDTTASTGVVLR